MIQYTKRYVNTISLFISIPVFLLFSSLISFTNYNNNINSLYSNPLSNFLKKDLVLVQFRSSNINQDTKDVYLKLKNNYSVNVKEEWKIIIPKISLDAEISEGTRKEVMDEFVGHFEETTITSGNVGLAAHNRGYPVNYFSDIKTLKEGDEIIYKYKDFEIKYVVFVNIIISDEDWSYLENTEDNRITLITCVENEPNYRRCVQGREVVEE